MQWTFFGQKKTLSLSGLFRNLIPENECRFLSDKRPAHVFYEFKTPATIAAVEESMNKLRRLPFLILLAAVRSSICWGPKHYVATSCKTRDLCALSSSMVTTQPRTAFLREGW